MSILNKKEIKIFLTFFLIYIYFIHWGGWYENSIFGLTRAIVDEGRFEIDTYANQTSDRAFYNGHYYTDKAPGTSFMAVPVYAAWKFMYYNFFPNNFRDNYSGSDEYVVVWSNEKVSLIKYVNPGFFVLTSMILITIFTSCLFSALTVILIYKISRYFTKNENHRILLAIIYGIGGLAFTYALSIFTHQIGLFFVFLSFYLLFKIKQEKVKDYKYFLLAGLSMGFAGTSDFTAAFVGLPILIYMLLMKGYDFKKKTTFFLIGCFIGLLPFILYNYSVLGTSFEFIGKYNDRNIFTAVNETTFNQYGFLTPNILVAYNLLFDQYRGLFFYYPVYLLSFIGLYYMFKKYRKEAILILTILSILIIFASSRITWHGGFSFGPRYLLFSAPFLAIPILLVFKRTKEKSLKIFFILLIALSIFINSVGLQTFEDWILERDTLLISEKYQTFRSLPNPLYEYYIPLFLEHGPRSMIFENLISGHIDIDIRNIPISRGWESVYVSEKHIPFLSLLPILVIVCLIWSRNLSKSIKKIKKSYLRP